MTVITVDYLEKEAAQVFCQSLSQTGFAVIKNHPIPSSLIQDFYQTWQSFFASPDKHHYTYKKPSQAGYFPFRTEKAKDHAVSDLKEFYHFYITCEHPKVINDITTSMFHHLYHLATELLQWIEQALPLAIASQLSMPLHRMIDQSPHTLLRILHYPPLTPDMEPHAVRAAPHEDINLLTLLPAATHPGLEVMNKHQQWYAINCDPSNIVVNVGDMLQECTNHFFKSTTHRVTNPTDAATARLSAPLFLHPRPDVRLSQSYTAGKYLNERLVQIGIL